MKSIQLILVVLSMLVCAVLGCKHQAVVGDIAFEEPVRIDRNSYIADGGSISMWLKDSKGQELQIWYDQSGEGGTKPSRHLYIGQYSIPPTNCIKVPIGSKTEREIVRLVETAFDRDSPEWRNTNKFITVGYVRMVDELKNRSSR